MYTGVSDKPTPFVPGDRVVLRYREGLKPCPNCGHEPPLSLLRANQGKRGEVVSEARQVVIWCSRCEGEWETPTSVVVRWDEPLVLHGERWGMTEASIESLRMEGEVESVREGRIF